MFSIRTLLIAVAVSTGAVLAMPAASQAMPQAASVKIDTASNGNFVQVHYRRYCRYGRCYRHARYHRYHRYRYYRPYYGYYRPYYYRPYYGGYYPYYGGYYPYYGGYPYGGPWGGSGIGLYFSF